MGCCINVACFFCTLCVFIGLGSLIQFCSGIYLSFMQPDLVTINRLIKTDKFDSYLYYILLIFVGLGLISLVLSSLSIYGAVKRLKGLSLFIAVLWVFAALLNIVILTISLLYYYIILPQLRPLIVRTLQQSPLSTSTLLDTLQSKYTCCGINNKDDYNTLSLEPFPSSCCRVPNCWRDTDINNNNGSNNTVSLMHTNGCYPFVEKYVALEIWILIGVAGFCALVQIFAVMLMCTLHQRYKKFDDNPKFVINHFGDGIPINENINNSNNNLQGSSQTMEETVEITQI